MITISLKETNNNLIATEPLSPIVCGNSNYRIEVEFGESWKSITSKVAIIVVDNQKTAVGFNGNTFKLPALPNAFKMSLVIMSDETETEKLTTSVLELETEPTLTSANIEEFEPISEYAQTVLGKITEFANGTAKVKLAETAETAETAKNASNPNLLINGNFRVNQRGQTTYTATGYTVDRWFISGTEFTATPSSNSLTVVNNSSTNCFIYQMVEDYTSLLGKTICLSIETNETIHQTYCTLPETLTENTSYAMKNLSFGSLYAYFYGAGRFAFTICLSANTTITLTFAKLELGTTATTFSPKPYAEELALCQRFYEKIDTSQNGNIYNIYKFARNNWMFFDPIVCFLHEKRVRPTIKVFSSFTKNENCIYCSNEETDVEIINSYITTSGFVLSSKNGNFISNNLYYGFFEADAEIY